MPRTAKLPAPVNPPKRPTTVLLDADLWDWMQQHVPRATSISSFINEAVRAQIDRARTR